MPFKPLIMGVVNLTPDSFYPGARHPEIQAAIDHAKRLIDEGADYLDLGAESSRPGALPVAAEIEIGRLLPVIDALAGLGVPLSIDTRKPSVMRQALLAGARMINDISGFTDPEAAACVAELDAQAGIMHMAGNPQTMQVDPQYNDVVSEVAVFLRRQAVCLHSAGVLPASIWLDPGIGFGKTLAHNVALLKALPTLAMPGSGILLGVSRKSFLGAITGRAATEDRLPASLAAALHATEHCAEAGVPLMLRVHDVAATRDALAVWSVLSTA